MSGARDWARSHPEFVTGILIGFAAFIVYEVSRERGVQQLNTYVWQADAFLHGRLHMPEAPAHLDWVFFNRASSPPPGVLPRASC